MGAQYICLPAKFVSYLHIFDQCCDYNDQDWSAVPSFQKTNAVLQGTQVFLTSSERLKCLIYCSNSCKNATCINMTPFFIQFLPKFKQEVGATHNTASSTYLPNALFKTTKTALLYTAGLSSQLISASQGTYYACFPHSHYCIIYLLNCFLTCKL